MHRFSGPQYYGGPGTLLWKALTGGETPGRDAQATKIRGTARHAVPLIFSGWHCRPGYATRGEPAGFLEAVRRPDFIVILNGVKHPK